MKVLQPDMGALLLRGNGGCHSGEDGSDKKQAGEALRMFALTGFWGM